MPCKKNERRPCKTPPDPQKTHLSAPRPPFLSLCVSHVVRRRVRVRLVLQERQRLHDLLAVELPREARADLSGGLVGVSGGGDAGCLDSYGWTERSNHSHNAHIVARHLPPTNTHTHTHVVHVHALAGREVGVGDDPHHRVGARVAAATCRAAAAAVAAAVLLLHPSVLLLPAARRRAVASAAAAAAKAGARRRSRLLR